MANETVGFVGGGRITGIILDGLRRGGAVPATVVVSDPAAAVLGKLKERHPGITATPDNAVAASQDVVFLAVHPPLMGEVLPKIAGNLKAGAIAVSLAPKFTIAKLSGLLGGFQRIARVIPNAPSVIGAGFNPVCFAAALSPAERQAVKDIVGAVGECPEVAEEKLEAYAVLAAMGPTYFWFQFEQLLSLGRSFGLTEGEAATALEKMVTGAVETLTRSGLSPEQVKDLVPVKPLGEVEASWAETYRGKLTAIYQKIKP
ncbi:MAG: pyrroline-5-carboxylate reductase family protein [Tepidisphaerales bacterium]